MRFAVLIVAAAACASTHPSPPLAANPGPWDPQWLDRRMIVDSVERVKPQLASCSAKSQTRGTVKLHLKVAADGGVSAISVVAAQDSVLADCVLATVKGARFPATQYGGAFTYPFVF